MSVAGFRETCRISSSDLLIFEVVARGLAQISFFTAGGFNEPLRIDGLLSLGQYIRSIGRCS
jgi:hypothetical protein